MALLTMLPLRSRLIILDVGKRFHSCSSATGISGSKTKLTIECTTTTVSNVALSTSGGSSQTLSHFGYGSGSGNNRSLFRFEAALRRFAFSNGQQRRLFASDNSRTIDLQISTSSSAKLANSGDESSCASTSSTAAVENGDVGDSGGGGGLLGKEARIRAEPTFIEPLPVIGKKRHTLDSNEARIKHNEQVLQTILVSLVDVVPGKKLMDSLQLFKTLLTYGCNADDIINCFKTTPTLITVPMQQWNDVITFFTEDRGFATGEVLKMLALCPSLVVEDQKRMASIYDEWRKLGSEQSVLFDIFSGAPFLLQIPFEKVLPNLEQLRGYYSFNRVMTIVSKCPNVCTDALDVLVDKLSYLHHEMFVNDGEVSKSHALSHSLRHIKTRHMFLMDTGVFKKRNIYKEDEFLGNPTLQQICDTTDEVFAFSVAGVSVEEYVVYEEMMAERRRREGMEETDDEDDTVDARTDDEDDDDGKELKLAGKNRRHRRRR